MDTGFIAIVGIFMFYYFLILYSERKLLRDPKDIIDKFLSVLLLYAGISIIFFSLTGKHFLTNTEDSYRVYLFIIGLIAILWTIPNLLQEFSFFRKFLNIEKKYVRKEKRELKKIWG